MLKIYKNSGFIFVLISFFLIIFSCRKTNKQVDNKIKSIVYKCNEVNKGLISCNTVNTFYNNGNIHTIRTINNDNKINGFVKVFYPSGELQAIMIYKNGIEVDSSIYYYDNGKKRIITYPLNNGFHLNKHYYENGVLSGTGKLKNLKKTGWWKFYDSKGNIKKEIEFLSIDDKEYFKSRNYEYINQNINYSNNKIVEDSSSYFILDIKDTLATGKSIGHINYIPKYSKEGRITVCVGYGIKSDFSNIIEVKLDSFGITKQHNWFGVKFDTSGKKIIRGIIIESYLKEATNKENPKLFDISIISHRKYFEKEVYVKE